MRERIAKLMELEQMSPTRFAQLIGIQPSIVSHILNGRNKASLEVAQKILNAFPSVNPDWLIMGTGTMYREELPSRQTSLFDVKPEIQRESIVYDAKKPEKIMQQTTSNQEVERKTELKNEVVPEKTVKKITVYYSDRTFEEFIPDSVKG